MEKRLRHFTKANLQLGLFDNRLNVNEKHETSDSMLCPIPTYFGEKVSMYFGWMTHYISFLILVAIPGTLLFFIQVGAYARDGSILKQHPLTTLYSAYIAVWSTLYIESWKRRQRELAVRWGMHDFSQHERIRSSFEGDEMVSPITGQIEKWYPPIYRKYKYYCSLPVLFTMIGCAVATFTGLRFYRDTFAANHVATYERIFHLTIAGIGNGISINVFNFIYQIIARWLTEWENHRTQSGYENSLILKTFAFQFVNSNAAIAWAAFKERSEEKTFINIAAVMITKQFVDLFKEIWIPRILVLYRRDRLHHDLAERNPQKYKAPKKLSFCSFFTPINYFSNHQLRKHIQKDHHGEWEDQLEPWDGLLDDFAEMCIQFGQITMFASAFPLGPLFSLLNNTFEVQAEVNQYIFTVQRPRYEGTSSIGAWQQILEFISFCGVISNGLLIYFTSDKILQNFGVQPGDDTTRLWVVVISEHILFFLKFALSFLIPDSPEWVIRKLAREEYKTKRLDHTI